MIEVKAEDRNDDQLKYGEQTDLGESMMEVTPEHMEEFRVVKRQLERQKRVITNFRQKIEKDLKLLQNQIKLRRPSSSGDGSLSTDSDFYMELGNI